MSRVNKNNQAKKQRIKETIIGLTLAISIGTVGSLGSYAYFSDRVNANNGIKITMGTLDVGIGEGFNLSIDGYQRGNEYFDDEEIKFEIKNEGTLDEILTLKFENISFNGSSQHDDLSKVEYELKILDENGNIVYSLDESDLGKLSGKNIKLGRLNSGKKLYCIAEIDDEGIGFSYGNDTTIKFDLVVEGVQINDKSVQNGGVN